MARAMKDSGIEWIGEIPEDWKLEKLKNVATVIRGGSPRPIEKFMSDNNEGFNWIKIGDTLKGSKYITHVKQKIIKDGLKYTRFIKKGSLILTNSMSYGEPYILQIDGCIHDGWVALINLKNINKEFLYYVLVSELCRVQFKQQVEGGVVQNLNIEKIGQTIISLPNIETQLKISSILDKKCAEIDQAITGTKETIEDYKKYKQAVITEAVCKGLNPDVEMKDSGIEWIGEIPKDWGTLKIKYSSWLKGRIGWQGLTSNEYLDEGAYLITGTDFDNGYINWETCTHISKERFDEDSEIHIKENDLLITKDGTVGKVAIAKNCPDEVSLNSGVLLIRNTGRYKYVDKYLYYVLLSDVFWWWYENSQMGHSTIRHLYQAQFYNFEFPYPAIEVQREIADYLDNKCAEIDKIISEKESLVSSLEEYKESMIYEYITGKKEVV